MYVWVIKTFDRDDSYCDYDSEVKAVYSEEHFEDAKDEFDFLCENRTDEGDEVEEWENEKGYHFRSENGKCENFRMSYVGLIKMEVQ